MPSDTNNPASNPAGVKVGETWQHNRHGYRIEVVRFTRITGMIEGRHQSGATTYHWLSSFHRDPHRTGFSPVPTKGQPDAE